jgi:hypothetical protein
MADAGEANLKRLTAFDEGVTCRRGRKQETLAPPFDLDCRCLGRRYSFDLDCFHCPCSIGFDGFAVRYNFVDAVVDSVDCSADYFVVHYNLIDRLVDHRSIDLYVA